MEPITYIFGYAIKKIITQSVFSEIPPGATPIGDVDGNGHVDYILDSDGDSIIDTLLELI